MIFAHLSPDPLAAVDAALAGAADGIAVATSGSTGAPRVVRVPAAAVRASASATAARLGEAGWLLAIPADRIGGAMVVARARLADAPLSTLPPGRFTADAFAAAASSLPDGPHHVSLVPTQLRRLLAEPAGREALARFEAVLVGGAALPDAELPPGVVSTYGMSETSGGCVYDGRPLDGVEVAIGPDGRIRVAGPTLAAGYADGDDAAFETNAGRRWFVTSDLGELRDGVLTVLGRADHVINTGGVKVHPLPVERALEAVPGVEACAVVGVPDTQWGERVVAVLAGAVDDAALASAISALPGPSRPRRIVRVGDVPRTAGGKIDRAAARSLAAPQEEIR
ncbi:AMP-binding enzyme [Demequina lignilytica]|uniref:AMP-binding protein n=1 Tax=Demequina lignilytica TaxID=3051663 RepID=A0AB35MGN2_9MICO|nr:AMP-binding protein [Demequina sp. SYSU T0a273]MDN4482896.1 AMP-binding protein [Demequina sp. SYSU T0a273]